MEEHPLHLEDVVEAYVGSRIHSRGRVNNQFQVKSKTFANLIRITRELNHLAYVELNLVCNQE